ncbi:type II toxin-antitoxin system RelE family toxin [Dietzia massiliensis]|uniref:type II toxin-antitoxin system RelE family toxin n=1 Tax=Dietzia massiliensis TaxID=2697499 RepID=UPI001BCC5842|nr:type II toxin-antitoxin system RelE/ParE family toxin [Dietzia massiliensis]MBS7549376.1 type II toxin-antitoxin system RelE/ParE family toxin [Dietzia massiliensis]
MPYSISYKPSAATARRKLHPTEQKRIVRAIEALAGTPRPPGAIQLAGGDGELRIRVGDHRIIYDIEDDALVVLVLRIGHRSDVYT